jgi:cytochrome c553
MAGSFKNILVRSAILIAASGVAFTVLDLGADAQQPTADPKVLAYGKHLARECTGCHRIDGTDNGIPSITGQPIDEFTENMKYYQTGARNNPAMVSVAQSLDEAQITALAAFYGSLPKGPRGK